MSDQNLVFHWMDDVSFVEGDECLLVRQGLPKRHVLGTGEGAYENPVVIKIYAPDNGRLRLDSVLPDEHHWLDWKQNALDSIKDFAATFNNIDQMWHGLSRFFRDRGDEAIVFAEDRFFMTYRPARQLSFDNWRVTGPPILGDTFKLYVEANEKYRVVARLGKRQTTPNGQPFIVDMLTDDAAEIRQVEAALDYYLNILPAERRIRDPEQTWEYQQYHCSTSANIYSSVHWQYEKCSEQPDDQSANWLKAAKKHYRLVVFIVALVLPYILLRQVHPAVDVFILLVNLWATKLSLSKVRQSKPWLFKAGWIVAAGYLVVITISIFIAISLSFR